MKINEVKKTITGLKIPYIKIIKKNEYKAIKKDFANIENYLIKLSNTNDEHTYTKKISINAEIVTDFKNLIDVICNDDTKKAVATATNNQIKKALSMAIFDNSTKKLTKVAQSSTQALYNYNDNIKVFATIKDTIENIKSNCKTLGTLTKLDGSVVYCDIDKLVKQVQEQHEKEKQEKALARKNAKAKANEKASKQAKAK